MQKFHYVPESLDKPSDTSQVNSLEIERMTKRDLFRLW